MRILIFLSAALAACGGGSNNRPASPADWKGTCEGNVSGYFVLGGTIVLNEESGGRR